MEFTGDEVVISKGPNDLDRLLLDAVDVLLTVGVEHAVVSGYVAVLFGRARATEAIDVLVERFDAATADDPVTNAEDLEDKHARIREQRIEQIEAWAEYVRPHPDEVWGEQVNRPVNSQLEAARHHEDDRPDPQRLRESPLLDDEAPRTGDRGKDDEG